MTLKRLQKQHPDLANLLDGLTHYVGISLTNLEYLPADASRKDVIEALNRDASHHYDRADEIKRAANDLIIATAII